MIMKKRALIMFVILAVIITGCQKTPSADPSYGSPSNVYRGYSGLKMSFAANYPPLKMYDETPLHFIIETENEGTYDLTGNCQINLYGYDTGIITGLKKTESCGNLNPRTTSFPIGGIDNIEFYTENIFLPDGVSSLKQNFVATACYQYRTVANPVVCVDPALYKPFPTERACRVADVITSGGQGAPVSVDKIEVDMQKGTAQFRIHISNKGFSSAKTSILSRSKPQTGSTGTVISRTASILDDCPFNIGYNDKDIVDYYVEMPSGRLLECSPMIDNDYRVRLKDNRGVIVCRFAVDENEPAYTSVLNIVLDYNYMESISRQVELVKTP